MGSIVFLFVLIIAICVIYYLGAIVECASVVYKSIANRKTDQNWLAKTIGGTYMVIGLIGLGIYAGFKML